jgi:hypothetical protein
VLNKILLQDGTQAFSDQAMSRLSVQIMGTENTSFAEQQNLSHARNVSETKSTLLQVKQRKPPFKHLQISYPDLGQKNLKGRTLPKTSAPLRPRVFRTSITLLKKFNKDRD